MRRLLPALAVTLAFCAGCKRENAAPVIVVDAGVTAPQLTACLISGDYDSWFSAAVTGSLDAGCSPVSAEQLKSAQKEDDLALIGGNGQLFTISTTTPVRVTWLGTADTHDIVDVGYLEDGKRFRYFELVGGNGGRMEHSFDVPIAPGAKEVRVLVSSPTEKLFTDVLSFKSGPGVADAGEGASLGVVQSTANGRKIRGYLRELVRGSLTRGDFAKAEDSARLLWAEGGKAASCLPEIMEANGHGSEARTFRQQFSQTTEPLPPPITAPFTDKAFVVASSLTLRAEPAAVAKPLLSLPIGTELEVLAVDGGFAQVKTSLSPLPNRYADAYPFLEDGEELPSSTLRGEIERGPTIGFASTSYLSGAAPDPIALEKATHSADLGERLAAMERLSTLQRDPVLTARLAGEAFDAQRCSVAIQAARNVSGLVRFGAFDVESFDLIYGCRGDRQKAAVFTPSDSDLQAKKVPANSCAANVVTVGECPFCPLGFEEGSEEAKKEEERLNAEEAQLEARRTALAELYPGDSPMIRIRVRRRTQEGTQIYVQLSRPATESCGEPGGEEGESKVGSASVGGDRIGELVELWIHVPSYSGYLYSLAPTTEKLTSAQALHAGTLEPSCCCD